ncbi:MAG: right-handed parallel beta-helix repeat-containing protein [Thermoplasmata archaeon]|nr:MAG: right-handed parallel beta-helix repeat-containing protein [Thermoplasmata archaeon]
MRQRLSIKIANLSIVILLVLAIFAAIDFHFEIVLNVSCDTIYVDDSGGADYTSIQDGVNAAKNGDTVYVYSGNYWENVVIKKSINLVGQNRDTTIIYGYLLDHVIYIDADWVNIKGLTIIEGDYGIYIYSSLNIQITNNIIKDSCYGIHLYASSNIDITDNIITGSQGPIDFDSSSWNNIIANDLSNSGLIWLLKGSNNFFKDNIITKGGFELEYTSHNIITNNKISNGYTAGIEFCGPSNYNNVTNNEITGCNWEGIFLAGIDNIIEGNIISNNEYGIWALHLSQNKIINNRIENNRKDGVLSTKSRDIYTNCSISNSNWEDFHLEDGSYIKTINTIFNKTRTKFKDSASKLIVQWYLHLNIVDYLGNPVSYAQVKIEDNLNGSYDQTFITDSNGQIRWLTITEYIEQDTDGNNIGEKTYHTPHKIVAWNDTLVGYAQPFIDESKTIDIVLHKGTLLDLETSWNLISLPRPQSDPNLKTVFQSIENQYDAVQWYNITDTNDPWKHHHISKPSYLNDLNDINHTMGLWVHVTDPGGTTLVVMGDELTSNQDISLYPGWNLVGFPSKTNKTRVVALDTLNFGSDVDAIWTYNASTQKWVKLDEATDYFEIGKGYWIHSRVTKVWNIPL